MPFKPLVKRGGAPPPEEENTFIDKARAVGGGVTRVLGGVGSSIASAVPGIGTLLGGGIGGASEALAEVVEGSELNPYRIGVEATLGAVPMGKIFKAGKVAESAIRSGAFSAAGTAGRQWSEDGFDEIDPKSVLTSGALGAGLGGALGKFMKLDGTKPDIASKPLGPKTSKETAQETVANRAGRFSERNKNLANKYQDQFETTLSKKIVGRDKEEAKELEKLLKSQERAAEQARKHQENQDKLNKILSTVEEKGLKPGSPSVSTSMSAKTAEGGTVSKRVGFKAPKKNTQGGPRREHIDEDDVDDLGSAAVAPKGPPPEGTYAREIFDQYIAGGRNVPEAISRTELDLFREADELGTTARALATSPAKGTPKAAPVVGPVTPAPVAATPTVAEPVPAPVTPAAKPLSSRKQAQAASLEELMTRMQAEGAAPVAQAADEAPSALMNVFKSRLDAAGQNYGAVKAAKAAGEKVPDQGRALAGMLAQQERKAAGLPAPARAAKQPPPSGPTAPQQTQPTAEYAFDQPGVGPMYHVRGGPSDASTVSAAKLKELGIAVPGEAPAAFDPKLPGQLDELSGLLKNQPKGPGGESGEINPLLLARFGLGAAGALTGAAIDPFDDRVASALAGGAVGALAPSLLKSLGAPPELGLGIDEAIQSPEGIKATAKRIYAELPHIQRFNYLMSGMGLPANAIVGPYGSAFMASLEHGLSGDPRGWRAMKLLTDLKGFGDEVLASKDTAIQRIIAGDTGRAEAARLPSGDISMYEKIASFPGVAMVSGDEAARKFLVRAGFTEDEARRITLTAEPELLPFRRIANFTKGSPLLQMLAPFTRTPANIWEQAAQRAPGVGQFVQAARETQDPLRQQIVQQGLSLGTGAVGAAAGYNMDPETARNARRYLTNFAGQYSLPTTVGFGVGQALREDQSPLRAAVGAASSGLPLPTTDTFSEWGRFLEDPSVANLPRGAAPGVLRELGLLETPQPTRLRGLRGIRRRQEP